MSIELLERRLRNYCQKLCNLHRKKNRIPKTSIGANYKTIDEFDHSGFCPSPLAPKLEVELIKIAPLGTKGHRYFVGCCCEVRSSNKIILARPNVEIKDIIFTKARRTRTLEKIKRCKNCKEVFG